ncbi:MAG: hypothetical protein ACI8S6_005409 [Myxococcota bacterium]
MNLHTLLRSNAAAIVVLTAATAVVAAPLLAEGQVYSSWDALFSAVFLERLQWSLLTGADWTVGPAAWPVEDSITQADWMGGQALLGLPLRWMPVHRMYALLGVMGLWLTALATAAAARALMGAGPHTWIAGIAGGLSCALVAHGAHINLTHHELLVAGAALLAAGLHTGQLRHAALGGLFLALSAQLGLYVGFHAVVVFGLLLLTLPRLRPALAAVAGAALGGLTLVPVLRAYQRAADANQSWYGDTAHAVGSWDIAQSMLPSPYIPLHAPYAPTIRFNQIVSQVNPGYTLVVLGLVGVVLALWQAERRRLWIAVVVVWAVSAALAMGPEITVNGNRLGTGPHWLLSQLPGGRGFRVPARWLQVTFIANALLAALVVQKLSAWRPVVGVIVGVMVLVELPQVQVGKWTTATLDPEPVYGGLLDGLGPMVEIAAQNRPGCNRFRNLSAAALHHRPLVGGTFARRVPALERANQLRSRWPHPDTIAFFDEIGVEVVLEHPPIRRAAPEGWSCVLVDGHRICRR